MMEAELRQLLAPTTPRHRQTWRDVVFSVSEARRALPYIARLVADAADAVQIALDSRDELGCVAVIADRRRRRELSEQRDSALQRLNRAIDDCEAVGAHLIDVATGRIFLQGLVHERPVCLVWRLGDDVSEAWRDLCAE